VNSVNGLADSPRVCPVCQAKNFKRLRNCKNQRNPFWRKCSECKSVYARTVPSSEELADLYLDYYNSESPEVPAFVAGRLREVFARLNTYRSEINGILDIGFGAGTFLDVASQEGWKCHGTEYSPDSIKDALGKGWTVHMGDLSKGDLAGPFDLVSAIEVLEHVAAPDSVIENASKRLRVGGVFYGTTPNGWSLNLRVLGEKWSVLSYPEHQVLLNPKSLRLLMTMNSLSPLQVRTKGINPADLINSLRDGELIEGSSVKQTLNRVELGYSINSIFEKNIVLHIVKKIVNALLSSLKLGDSMEFLGAKLDN
jgi:2-polyprenyl-3-methyl-5-hydroxy-6-metoxy-1,4-benzoquinol methylase